MALISCPDCGSSVSDAAAACLTCGRPMRALAEQPAPPPPPPPFGLRGAAVEGTYPLPQEWPAYRAVPAVVPAVGELHPLAIHKPVLMSLATFGVYDVYWLYRNWSRVREKTGRSLSPFWRAIFAPLWAFSLFEEVKDQARPAGVDVPWNPMALGLLFFVLSMLWRLPDPWWLVSYVGFVPLLPVQATINDLAARRGVKPDSTFQVQHVVVLVVGALFLLLAIIGTLLPE